MEAKTRIRIDMLRKSVSPVVDAMQFDALTRIVEIELYSNGVAWNPPDGVTFSVSYGKPDGKRGFYETLPDGTSAISVAGNVVSVTLAPHALTVAGTVLAALVMRIPDSERLSAFPFEIHVTADPSAGKTNSDDYFNPEGGTGGGSTDSGGSCSMAALKSWEIVQSSDAVTLNYTLEDGSAHTDVITFDANGYPVSITHNGVTAEGTWTEG